MLSSTLNTNEIRNAAGVEQEFTHRDQTGRTREFQLINEIPARPHRLGIAHQETGDGLKKRRRSRIRFDLTVISDVDNVTPVVVTFVAYVDAPVGALNTSTPIANVLANGLSFIGTTDGTTLLLNGTGNGAKCLINGEL